jgi:transposase
MRTAPVIELDEDERVRLDRLRRSRLSPVRVQERANVVLLAADGLSNKEIAARLKQDPGKVGRWRRRFAEMGLEGILKDKTRPGRIPAIAPSQCSEIVKMTLEEKPEGRTHWSRSSMAKAAGVSESTVGRIWAAYGLKPHRTKLFKLSNDPQFQEKLEAIVGLYLNPPENAIVLACDEKSQIQALDRTQPGLPLKKGRGETFTHDYKRNGTTSLFAALNTLTGEVIGTCMPKHRHEEWLRFLNLIRRKTAKNKTVHIICDNYATHKHEKVREWLARNPRFQVHFTPTSASWLNMVERFFRDLTVNSLRRGVFKSLDELKLAIDNHIQVHNQEPKPFIWTAKASDILEKVKRGRAALNKTQSV